MGELLEKRGVQAGLALVVLLVWGYNMLTIVDITTDDEPTEPAVEMNLDETMLRMPERDSYEYSNDFRDPFRPELSLQRRPAVKKKPKPAPKKKPIRIPDFKLTGIIEGTVMLQAPPNNTVYFAMSGDSVAGAQVVSVARDSVVLVYKQKKITVRL